MTDASEPIIVALLELTRQGDVLSLNAALQRCILRLVPRTQVRVYERSGPSGGWRLAQVGADACEQVREQVRLSQSVKDEDARRLWSLRAQEERVLVDRDGHSVKAVFPVRRGMDLVAGSVVDGKCCDQEFAHLQILMEAYTNIFSSLYRGSHDTLTGLLNRNTFDDRIRALVEDASEQHLDFGALGENRFFVILDIDHFKRINDNFGHLYGDEVLLMFAQIMSKAFRDGDLLFRFGGEEFVIILNDVDSAMAHNVLERFCETLRATDFPQVGRVTCSIGFTHLDISRSTEIISDRADQALYYAKNHGRDQVCYFEALVDAGKIVEEEHLGEIDLF